MKFTVKNTPTRSRSVLDGAAVDRRLPVLAGPTAIVWKTRRESMGESRVDTHTHTRPPTHNDVHYGSVQNA